MTRNYKSWDIPWPILHYGRGEGVESFGFFPIYGYKKKRTSFSKFFLWPLYSYRKDVFEGYDDTTHRFLLLNKYRKKVWQEGFKDSKTLRVWPLFFYDRKEDGTTRFSWPELIPIDDEGFERNWAHLFRLYQYNADMEGNMESKFLWGVYRHKKTGSGEFFEISFLMTYERDDDFVFLSILKGLFEYQHRGDETSIKLLYLPWRMKWRSPSEFLGQNEFQTDQIWISDFFYDGS